MDAKSEYENWKTVVEKYENNARRYMPEFLEGQIAAFEYVRDYYFDLMIKEKRAQP